MNLFTSVLSGCAGTHIIIIVIVSEHQITTIETIPSHECKRVSLIMKSEKLVINMTKKSNRRVNLLNMPRSDSDLTVNK